MKTFVLVLSCVVLNSVAQIMMRFGAQGSGSQIVTDVTSIGGWISLITCAPVLFGILLWTLSTLIWLYVLAQTPLSYAFALYGMNFLVTPLAAVWLLAEPLSAIRVLGMMLTTAGVALTVGGNALESWK